jgi:DNA-binding Xre family transcriptional regulator
MNGRGDIMKMSDRIKIMMIKSGVQKEADLAKRMEISPQTLNSKMKKDYFTIEDLQKVASALDCKLTITFSRNDTGEEL